MRVVALIPAKDREDSVAATVRALAGLAEVDEVVVVDDGSADGTREQALSAGARVVGLPENRGKGGAVAAAVEAVPDADVYLLIDADVGDTAAVADAILRPVLAGEADLAIGVLPPAAGRGGFGKVRDLARRGIRRASGFEAKAPLSGQRAVRGDLLRSLDLAPRFGLETALTIDAVRAGARVVEVDVAMEHRHTGRSAAGFRHRGRQGVDIVLALWPRVTTARQRVAAVVAFFVLLTALSLITSSRSFPSSVAVGDPVGRVVLFGMPGLEWDDVGTGRLPVLDGLVERGSVAATSVRTASGRPSTVEGYATLGAAARVKADPTTALAFDADESVGGQTAANVVEGRTGLPFEGEVAVVGAPATLELNEGRHLPSLPGALGDALKGAGKRVAVIGNADLGAASSRPAAVALMDSDGQVAAGSVGEGLVVRDPSRPFGVRADAEAILREFREVDGSADIVLVDPGDLDRAAALVDERAVVGSTTGAPSPALTPGQATGGLASSPSNFAAARRQALADTDALLGRIAQELRADDFLLVVSVRPATREWHTTPMVGLRPGAPHGYLHSPSTRRPRVVTLTDVAPTVLEAVGAEVPKGMIGHALRYRAGEVELDKLRRLDRDATFREGIYFPITLAYIVFQALVYLFAIYLFTRRRPALRVGTALKWIVLAIAAWPLATFVLRAVPNVAVLEGWAVLVLLAADAAIVAMALRAKRHSLSPLSWVLGTTVAFISLDVALGARLQTSSILGYSLHTAARFTGLGNTAFAVLAASTILFGAIHLWAAPASRRTEALWLVGCLFAFVVVVDGAPTLGDDVGGILTMVPVFALTLWAFSGRRLRLRTVLLAGLVAVAVLAVAVGIDLLRPPESRTHLGQFVSDIGTDGWEPFTTTVSRKWATNLRTYKSVWLWVIVIIAAYLTFFVAWGRGWVRLVPKGSPLRIGVVAVLAAGLAGNFLNDSGAVVTALVFVFMGPYLTLIALSREREQLVILHPREQAA